MLDGGHVAASEFVAEADGDVAFIEVGRPAQPSTADERKGKRVLLWMAVGAGVGGGLGLISNAGVDCHHEENLCEVRSIGGAVMGALAGLMIGTAR